MSDELYELHPISGPWGDYSDILIHGMASNYTWNRNPDGCLELERTGPFIPPITFPALGVIVVTDAFRRELEASPLRGCTFRPALKKRIVKLHWERWDQSAQHPPRGPQDWEPENYVFGRKHSQHTSEEMGDLWEIVLGEHMDVRREAVENSILKRVIPLPQTWDGLADIFLGRRTSHMYVSERGRQWFEERVSEWVRFEPGPTG